MLYAHLGLIYSLLIASSASIGRSELTQNDGVFVLVTVASPASFSLWFLTLRSLWDPNSFPIRKSDTNSTEVFLLKVLSLGSLAFETVMVCLIFISPNRLTFSQPACDRLFGDKLWIELLWETPYIVQMTWLTVPGEDERYLQQLSEPLH
ncbi:hypothetical protein C0995_013770 [Termitomyces sp. Mi166|nr:hypothetical protein C0995_013770 [Termitomyces sp. Mi166\